MDGMGNYVTSMFTSFDLGRPQPSLIALIGWNRWIVCVCVYKIVFKLKCIYGCCRVETTRVTEFEYYFACTCKGRSPIFCHESWQNDICSFRDMNVALTLSFKVISF